MSRIHCSVQQPLGIPAFCRLEPVAPSRSMGPSFSKLMKFLFCKHGLPSLGLFNVGVVVDVVLAVAVVAVALGAVAELQLRIGNIGAAADGAAVDGREPGSWAFCPEWKGMGPVLGWGLWKPPVRRAFTRQDRG